MGKIRKGAKPRNTEHAMDSINEERSKMAAECYATML
jgi:hypothetical protein